MIKNSNENTNADITFPNDKSPSKHVYNPKKALQKPNQSFTEGMVWNTKLTNKYINIKDKK